VKTLFILLFFAVFAAFAETSIYGNENRFMFASPRSFALGEANNAISDEPIPANNPASIILAQRTNFFAGYTSFYNNILWVGNTYATVLIDSLNVASFFVGYLSIPDIDSVRSILGSDPNDTLGYEISMVSSSELSINFNFARKLINSGRVNLSVGASVNMMRKRLIDLTGYGLGADVGVLLTTDRGNNVSLQIDNVLTQYTRWDGGQYSENTLPQCFLSYGHSRDINENLRVNLVYRSPDIFGNSGVVGSTLGEGNMFKDNVRSGSIIENPQNIFTAAGYGAEFIIKQLVALRAGLTSSHKLTFGGGVRLFERADIDFGYFYSSALDGTYGISFRFYL